MSHDPHASFAENSDAAAFHTTRWTRVIAARGASTEAHAALAALCEAYYEPIHAYIAYTTRDLGDPRDLAHAFFARTLAGSCFDGADPLRGRFRSYLLGAVKNFLSELRKRNQAARRGGDWQPVPLPSGTESQFGVELPAPNSVAPDAWFDRRWGLAVLQRGLDTLAAEYEAKQQSASFALLKPWLTGEALESSQAEVASRLAMTEGAVKVAIHRLRKRFREIIQAQILETVTNEEEMRAELRYLIEVVG